MSDVSVIIPNYNHAPYLKQRIESILNQTYRDFELIILDDCSTDSSREVIEQYRNHPNVSQIVYNQTNSGNTFLQWKKGMELAKGPYIWIAESDDYCEPGLLEALMPAFHENNKLAFAFVQSCCVNNDGRIEWLTVKKQLAETMSGTEFIKKHLAEQNTVFNASMVVFNKQYTEGINELYTGFKYCGDWIFWIELARKGNVFISGKVLNYFRQYGEGITSKFYISGLKYIEEIKAIFYMHDERLIENHRFIDSMFLKYLGFKNSGGHIAPDVKKEINKLFFKDTRTAHRVFKLWGRYRIYRTKEFLKKISDSLFTP